MKITVTASRRDDILRERAEYNDLMKKNNDVRYQQEERYEFAQDFNFANVENAIREQVGDLRGVRVRVDERYRGMEVNFDYEDRDEAKALRWSWSVQLDREGNITKNSSSWSGLEATTPEQAADLQRSVNIITKLINVDWKPILEKGYANRPKYSDYISLKEMRSREGEFAQSLKEAVIEDIIGQPKWIKGGIPEGQGTRWNYGSKRWYMIKSQSDKFYTVCYISDHTVEQCLNHEQKNDPLPEGDYYKGATSWRYVLKMELQRNTDFSERVKKANLLPVLSKDGEVMDMEGNITKEGGLPEESAEASTEVGSGLITL